VVEVDERYCKGCGLCVAYCERGVLGQATAPNLRGVYAACVVDGKLCGGCRRCTTVCPEGALKLYRP
jgi:2-oxoglutarate ferredoxin oxidoreductase subunit delta